MRNNVSLLNYIDWPLFMKLYHQLYKELQWLITVIHQLSNKANARPKITSHMVLKQIWFWSTTNRHLIMACQLIIVSQWANSQLNYKERRQANETLTNKHHKLSSIAITAQPLSFMIHQLYQVHSHVKWN